MVRNLARNNIKLSMETFQLRGYVGTGMGDRGMWLVSIAVS